MDNKLFSEEELAQTELSAQKQEGPVTCLGMTFENDEERRKYFREELRKKLPELRKIEGFPIGEDDDIVNLSDPPYYTACPNPWLNDFIAEWEKEKDALRVAGIRNENSNAQEPYASDVSEGKNNPVYTAHTYHTKVPHPAVMRYILHYTQPGDVVLDGFAGTGMTGVAAQACANPSSEQKINIEKEWLTLFKQKPIWGERHAICSDLSPYATMVSYNYNTPIDINLLKSEVARIFKELKEECNWMYKTLHDGKEIGEINCVVWSDVLTCHNCGQDYVYWDAAVDKQNKCIKDNFVCPYCQAVIDKGNSSYCRETFFDDSLGEATSTIKNVPVYIAYSVNGHRYEKIADAYDRDLAERINSEKISSFFPSGRLPEGGETRRNDKIGITHYHHFYTRRNLYTLSLLLHKIEESQLPNKIKFIFTGMINRSSKMNRMHVNHFFNGGGGWNGGNLKGTLYVPNLPVETSVIEQIEDKLNGYIRAAAFLPKHYGNALYAGSADTILLQDNTIDYIFVDPPFGANIAYSELNTLPESWLRVFTNNRTEAIVNDKQGKNSTFYLQEMTKCFREFYRVLKPGKWITIEFSNTSASIWNMIQTSIANVGFVLVNVSALDKKQGSFNAVTTTTAVKQDLVITCFKPSGRFLNELDKSNDVNNNVWDFIEEYLLHLPVHLEKGSSTTSVVERNPKILYDRLITYYVQRGYPVPLDAATFQQGLRERYIEIDGMFFTAAQAAEYEEKKRLAPEFVPMGIIVSDEANGIQWLKNLLRDKPQTYQEIQPEWMQAINGVRKNDILPELRVLLDENFIEQEDGKWRLPNIQDDVDKELLRTKSLMKEFKLYVEAAQKPKAKIKEARVEALRAGFKQCYIDKDFQTIVTVGDKIPQNLLTEDEVLLQFYDIAINKI